MCVLTRVRVRLANSNNAPEILCVLDRSIASLLPSSMSRLISESREQATDASRRLEPIDRESYANSKGAIRVSEN